MSDLYRPRTSNDPDEAALESIGHPRGTLAIVAIFGLLLVVGWLSMYLFRFLGHGAPYAP